MSLRCYRKSDDRSLFLFLLSRFPNSVSFLRSAPSKNVRSDHSHNGRQPRAIRGSLPEAPWIGCPSVPRSHGEVAGAVSFLGLCRATSGPYDVHNKRMRFLSEGCASQRREKSVKKKQYSVLSTRTTQSLWWFLWVLRTGYCVLGTKTCAGRSARATHSLHIQRYAVTSSTP
jgi:hypothetical protein